MNPENEERRPLERRSADYAAERVAPRLAGALLASEQPNSGTPLQIVMTQFCRTLTRAQRLGDRDRAACADILARMVTNALGPELVIAEAERITRRAA